MTRKTHTPLWLRLLNRLAAADYRYRQAARLRDMPDFLLEDMGISRADADRAFLQSPFDRPADRKPLTLGGYPASR
jgi:uncharacterized protein YjiS (DUF1127 family)